MDSDNVASADDAENAPSDDASPFPSLFADADVISVYTRAQAIADGTLVDVTGTAREAGFKVPVALTSGVWHDAVRWTDEDEARKSSSTGQSEAGRLWDVLTLASLAVRRGGTEPSRPFEVLRVPAEGRDPRPRATRLVLHVGPGDEGELVATVMLPGED